MHSLTCGSEGSNNDDPTGKASMGQHYAHHQHQSECLPGLHTEHTPTRNTGLMPFTCAAYADCWEAPGRITSPTSTSWPRQGRPTCMTQIRLRWLGNVSRMDDGRFPKDMLATGTRLTGRPSLRYKNGCKRDLKAGGFNCPDLNVAASNRVGWRTTTRTAIKSAEEDRDTRWREKRLHRQQWPHATHRDKISPAANANLWLPHWTAQSQPGAAM